MDLSGIKKYEDSAKNALWNYVAGYTVTDINKLLRSNRRPIALTDACSLIDANMKPLDSIIVYRTVDWDYMLEIYNITKKNLKSCTGYEFVSLGYTSTTKTRQNVWSSIWTKDELLLEIHVKRNTKGVYINDIFKKNEIDCYEQDEVLLQRNLHFVIVDFSLMSKDGKFQTRKPKEIYCLKIQII